MSQCGKRFLCGVDTLLYARARNYGITGLKGEQLPNTAMLTFSP